MTDVLLQLVRVNIKQNPLKTLKSWKKSIEISPQWLQKYQDFFNPQQTGLPIHLLGQVVERPLVGLSEPPIFTPHSIPSTLSRRKLNFPKSNRSPLTATIRKQHLKVCSLKTQPPAFFFRSFEALRSPRFTTRSKSDTEEEDHTKWSYKRFEFPSPLPKSFDKLSKISTYSASDFHFKRSKSPSTRDCTDYLSLSLSPPGSRGESVFLRDTPSLCKNMEVDLFDYCLANLTSGPSNEGHSCLVYLGLSNIIFHMLMSLPIIICFVITRFLKRTSAEIIYMNKEVTDVETLIKAQNQTIFVYPRRAHSAYDNTKYSPSKEVSLLNLDDIRKIRYIENRESQEDEQEYENGGYMPINIGDILRNQYRVCRKLGWGHFSTVWLCKNLIDDGPRYAALKICKSAPMFTAVANDEIRLLQDTKSINPDHAGFQNIVQMVDTFKLISENGVHTAISMEIMGPNLLHLLGQSDYRGIQVPAVRRIIFQVLRGLTYLHEVCHIIHTDIKPENILIKVNESYIRQIIGKMERFNELGVELPRSYVSSEIWGDKKERSSIETEDEIITKFGEQRSSSYPNDIFLNDLVNYRDRHNKTNFTAPMWVNPNIEIKIADLGNACWVDHHFSQEIQTRQYRALEVILGAGYSYPADIWSVGCMAYELATGEMMFNPKGNNDHASNVDHLCLIWESLGGIPRYITETGSDSKLFFNEGRFKDVPEENLRIWKFEDVLVEKYKWKRVDAIPFAGFLESLVEPDPALRASASEALTNEWLNATDV